MNAHVVQKTPNFKSMADGSGRYDIPPRTPEEQAKYDGAWSADRDDIGDPDAPDVSPDRKFKILDVMAPLKPMTAAQKERWERKQREEREEAESWTEADHQWFRDTYGCQGMERGAVAYQREECTREGKKYHARHTGPWHWTALARDNQRAWELEEEIDDFACVSCTGYGGTDMVLCYVFPIDIFPSLNHPHEIWLQMNYGTMPEIDAQHLFETVERLALTCSYIHADLFDPIACGVSK